MRKTCGNCGHAKVCAVFINSETGCCQWSPCADTLEQRYQQLAEMVREVWHYVVARNTPDVPGVDMSVFEEPLEELGVSVDD